MKRPNILGRLKKRLSGEKSRRYLVGSDPPQVIPEGCFLPHRHTCRDFIAVCRTFAIDRTGYSRLILTVKKAE